MTLAADRLRRRIHDLSLHGARSRDEAHALNLLSYYVTGQTLETLAAAVAGTEPGRCPHGETLAKTCPDCAREHKEATA